MRGILRLLLPLLALAPPSTADIAIREAQGRIDVVAAAAPLADVLDRLARQTGMKIVYEGPAPRQLVTLSLVGRSPAEAVTAILEGQGLNYALILDATATRVEKLLVTGPSSARPSHPAPAPPRYVPPPVEPEPDDPPELLPPPAEPPPAGEGEKPQPPAVGPEVAPTENGLPAGFPTPPPGPPMPTPPPGLPVFPMGPTPVVPAPQPTPTPAAPPPP